MKKVILIMTMLVVSMGVSFTANAQGETLPYTMDVNSIDTEGWSVTLNTANQPATSQPVFDFGVPVDGDATMQKNFDFENMDSVEIYFNFDEPFATGYDITFSVYIDGVLTPINYTANTMSNTVMITDNSSFTSNSSLEIVMDYVSQGTPMVTHRVELTDFEVTGYEDTGSVGINENDLSTTLEVYSFDKSIFVKSNESMNANVTVYNMSGQVVNTQNLNLSYSKTEINLYDVPSGMYIVNVSDGSGMMSKKVFLE
jgi:hypothetical protein